jgi:outer membrane lipoprotein-sorting protein
MKINLNIFKAAAAAAIFLLVSIPARAETDPAKLLEAMDVVLRGTSHDMTVTFDVKTSSWERQYKLRVWMKGIDYTFVRLLEPARSEGQGFLRIKARLWNYLPAAERTILIPPSMMLDRFLGSDFSNDDLVKLSYLPRDYESKIVGEETLNGAAVYHLDLKPRPNAPVTYGRLEVWLRKEDSAPVRWYFYNEKMEHIRTVDYSEFKVFGKHAIPTVWHMTSEKEAGREATLKILDATFDLDIPDSLFTLQKLEQYP